MFFNDSVYGTIDFSEPVLIQIINSTTLQRLKNISQSGYFEPFFPNTYHTRFEHSLGVCHLLRRYEASLDEQVSGLLHDVSHTAFSHCVDYALSEGSESEQNYQDNAFETYVTGTEIPKILQSHGLSPAYIFDSEHFPLQETELPDLCADRIDYILRTGIHCKELDRKQVEHFLERLTVFSGRWAFKDLASAQAFASYFGFINSKYYCGPLSAIMFRTVGDALKYALGQGYLSKAQLFETDDSVLKRLTEKAESDSRMKQFLRRMNNPSGIEILPAPADVTVTCKSRAVDPYFIEGQSLKRLSQAIPEWKIELEKESRPKTYPLKFLD